MTKYARFVDCSAEQDASDVRTIDVVDTSAYQDPRPDWYTDDEALLNKIFSPELVAQWKADGQWFVPVPAGVEPGARFTGNDYANPAAYVNPDNTDGNGDPIPPPPEP